MVFPGYQHGNSIYPCLIESDGISIEQIKKAEKEDYHIIRLVEKKGSYSSGILKFKEYPVKISETNLIEWENNENQELLEDLEINFKPFEIRTYKVFM